MRTIDRKYQVFISSTFNDLHVERGKVIQSSMQPLLDDHKKLLKLIAKAEATKARGDGYFNGWVYIKHGNVVKAMGTNGWPPLLNLADRLFEHGLIERNDSIAEMETRRTVRLTDTGRALLSGQTASPPRPAAVPLDLRNMHPRVQEIAGPLASNGHYRQAVLDAFIGLIEDVKQKTKFSEDGVPLMQKTFSEKAPALKFAERDEQIGYMWLYAGAVMTFRNILSHRLSSLDSQNEALEILGLASHLFRQLDTTTV